MLHHSKILLLLLLFPLGIGAQQFHFRNYSLSEGLAQSQVYTLCQSKNGTIWMGTRGGGLSAFDGIRFQNYTTKDGLADNYILCLTEDSNGILWIGTNNGLCSFNGRVFKSEILPDSGTIVVESILLNYQNALIIGTQKGIYELKANKWNRFRTDIKSIQENITCLYNDHKNRLWIGNNSGLTCIDKKTIQHVGSKEGLPSEAIRCITEDAGGTIWIGTYGHGIAWITTKGIRVMNSKSVLPDPIVQSLYRDNQNRIWIGTQEAGAGYWNPSDSLFRFINERDGLCNNHIRCIIDDYWGNIWLGSSGGGVSKYFGQQFTHFDQRSGLPGRNVYALAEDSSGAIWFSTSSGGLCRAEGNLIKDFSRAEGFPTVKIKKLMIDLQNRLWIGTEGEGIYIYNGKDFTHLGNENGLMGNWIRDIIQDLAGNIWIAKAGGGIAKVSEVNSKFEIRQFGVEQGLPEDRINALLQDKIGRIWFATTSSGCGFIENDSIYSFNTKDGLSSQKLRSLTMAPNGDVWIGTADRGLSVVTMQGNRANFRSISVKQGLTSDNSYLLIFDHDGRLWNGTEKGLDRITLGSDVEVEEIKHYGYSEGFIGIETSQNAAILDSQGKLWFGTINGLTRFNPSLTDINKIAPILQLRDIRLFFKPLLETNYAPFWETIDRDTTSVLKLPYNQNHLSFDFFGVNQRNPEQVKYQWKLVGLDENWTPAGFQHNITYSNLPPGEYTLLYRAENEDGIWSESKSIHFSIEQPIWKRWWFLTISVGFLVVFVWIYFRWRLRRIKHKAKEAQEKLKLETDVLKLEQKALQLQMNPHFIFNALNSIQALIGTQDEKTARYYLSKFSRLMRQILESSREQLIPLEMEISILENYLSIEQFSHGVKFTWKINYEDSIDIKNTSILPMLIHPFVENAVIHGLIPKGADGHIQILFSKFENQLLVRIMDNGIGREKARERRSQQDQQHKSTALLVVQERLALLEGKTHIQINDLTNDDGSPIGTEVIVSLPFTTFE